MALSAVDLSRARYTIGLLNLNSPYLVTLRKNWLDEIDSMIDSHIGDEAALYSLASAELLPSKEGKLSQFFSATRARYGQIADRVLLDEAHKFK